MIRPSDLRSDAPTNAAIHDLSWFRSAFDPLPTHEDIERSARWIIEALAPEDGPRLKQDKEQVTYVIPTRLKVAPFVGKTGEKYPGQSGKQRSSSHVVAGSWFALDLDEADSGAWEDIQQSLIDSDLLFCAYSSWSHNVKPGARVRVLLFMDRALPPTDWKRAWSAINDVLFLRLLDKQTGHLAQQAGTWTTHPDRVSLAFRKTGGSKLLSADKLLEIVPQKRSQPSRADTPTNPFTANLYPPTTPQRLQDAFNWLDAGDYETWMAVCLGLKAAVRIGDLDDDAGLGAWLTFTEQAGDGAKAMNDDDRYNPEVMWERIQPTAAPASALIGKLFGMARDIALEHVRVAVARNAIDPISREAAAYLGRYHKKAFDELVENLENTL